MMVLSAQCIMSSCSINILTFCLGKCNVHLTGYLDPEFEEEEESSGGEEEAEDEAPTLVAAAKRKLENSSDAAASKKQKVGEIMGSNQINYMMCWYIVVNLLTYFNFLEKNL